MAELHNESVLPALLEDEMRNSYLDYSMSVIVSRAIPDVRDGLKPVHRRILFGMDELGLGPSRPYKKSARIVGEVLGKYHPHGDGAVYDSMVRMAQEWSLRYPLVDGQGNFGSVDGDSAAAMRYTEARFASISQEVLRDIDKETVDFRPNFDESLQEPTVMPTVVPMLLVNGSGGIAVGMATNIPPHNLREVVNGLLATIQNPDITTEELMQHITAPDFPTGGIIYGYDGVRDAYTTGRGRVRIRAQADVEEMKSGRERIIVTELPYQVNKAHLIEKIADLVRDKKLEDISDIRDESDRKGMRIVIEVKRDAMGSVVLNNLFKHTQMQTTFGVIMLALVNGRPKVMPLREVLGHFIDFRNEVIVRRTQYDLSAAQKRAHILEGYLIALDNIDAVIQTIRESADVQIASAALQSKFGLSPEQAKAILEMRLQRLTGLEREKIENEYRDLLQLIEQLQAILNSKELQMQEIANELEALREKYGDERRTAIEFNARGLTMEDMIAEEDMIVSITKQGFIKRTAAASYRAQSRGGRGLSGAGTRDKDFVEHLFQASTHHHLLFFTDHGRVFKLKVYELPEGMRNSKGRSINNVLEKQSDENVTAYLPVKEFDDETFVVMTTRSGVTKRVAMSNFANIRRTGIRAVNLNDDDRLISVALTDGNADIMIASRGGQLCRFHESELRPMGRTAAGVRGIRLDAKDHVVKMIAVADPEETIVIASENGYGKRNIVEDFRKTKRGAKGVRMMQITDKTGEIVSMLKADENMDLVMITVKGVLIRQHVSEIRVIGRNTQGVRLIKLDKKDSLADITRVEKDDEEELPTDENGVVIESSDTSDASDTTDAPEVSGESSEESNDSEE